MIQGEKQKDMQQLQLDVIQIKLLIRLFNVSKCPQHF